MALLLSIDEPPKSSAAAPSVEAFLEMGFRPVYLAGALWALLAVAVVGGLLFWGVMWWKTRELRRRMREQMDNPMQTPFGDVPASGGRIIEGEVIRSEQDPAGR